MKSVFTEKYSFLYIALSLTFCVCLIISNLVEIKTIPIGWLTITAGVIVFPISYIINDCITEVYGYRKARLMIWMGFLSSLAVTVILQLVLVLPGSEEWHSQGAMEEIYGAVPRIMFASYTAFLCGSLINAYTMSRMKKHVNKQEEVTGEHKRFAPLFAIRAIVSTIFGEGVDSVIFFPIAFGGILSWHMIMMLIITQTVIKTVYEILVLPITIRAVRLLRRAEGGC